MDELRHRLGEAITECIECPVCHSAKHDSAFMLSNAILHVIMAQPELELAELAEDPEHPEYRLAVVDAKFRMASGNGADWCRVVKMEDKSNG